MPIIKKIKDYLKEFKSTDNVLKKKTAKWRIRRGFLQEFNSEVDDSYAKSRILEINRLSARFFHDFLVSENGKTGMDYLLSLGLTLQTIEHFELGLAPNSGDSLMNYLKSKGFSLDDMVKAGLCGVTENGMQYDHFRNRVMFPIVDLEGNVIAFSGRLMPDDDRSARYVRYMNTGDTPVFRKSHNFYGLNFAKNYCQEKLILVEGVLDVITLHQAGVQNAAAILGTALTENHIKLISRYTNEVVIAFDADPIGKKATERAINMLQNSNIKSRVLQLPDRKDPKE